MNKSLLITKFSQIHFLGFKSMKPILFFVFYAFSFFQTAQAQSVKNNVLSSGAFEAEFYFDVFYSIVDCEGQRVVLITAFNESGLKQNVGFDIMLEDSKGTKQLLRVPIFLSKQAEMFQTSCESSNHSFLKFNLDKNFDVETISSKIEFYTK
jgi:hypothetical protein